MHGGGSSAEERPQQKPQHIHGQSALGRRAGRQRCCCLRRIPARGSRASMPGGSTATPHAGPALGPSPDTVVHSPWRPGPRCSAGSRRPFQVSATNVSRPRPYSAGSSPRPPVSSCAAARVWAGGFQARPAGLESKPTPTPRSHAPAACSACRQPRRHAEPSSAPERAGRGAGWRLCLI